MLRIPISCILTRVLRVLSFTQPQTDVLFSHFRGTGAERGFL